MTLVSRHRKAPHRKLLTVRLLRSLQPNDHVADSAMIGLAANVSAGGRVSYSFRYLTARSRMVRITVGYWPEHSPRQARWRVVALKNLIHDKAVAALSQEALFQRCADLERDLAKRKLVAPSFPRAPPGEKGS